MITFEEFYAQVKHLERYEIKLTYKNEKLGFWFAEVKSDDKNYISPILLKYLAKNDLGIEIENGKIIIG